MLASGPNQVWSWDITKLLEPLKWTYYYLYVILEIFSRYMVGWMVAESEAAALARELIGQTCQRQGVQKEQLILHADRGSPIIAKSLAMLLADLGVTKSHSRPHVSDDNPYSESQFKTLKYRSDYPERFGCVVDARTWSRSFFAWYNDEHHHSALGLMTPADVHFRRAAQIRQKRQQVLQMAYEQHPKRFVKGLPAAPQLPDAVWINPPQKAEQAGERTLAEPLLYAGAPSAGQGTVKGGVAVSQRCEAPLTGLCRIRHNPVYPEVFKIPKNRVESRNHVWFWVFSCENFGIIFTTDRTSSLQTAQL